ncbi:MAG: hypothetical protein KDH20_22380 [Rhodocyclaceae bacterium]|nr:hypothetical protein [Rhodocyclaceae bacterium]
MSKAFEVYEALFARVQQIDTVNGYATDVGIKAFRGRIGLQDDEGDCVTLVDLQDSSAAKPGRLSVEHLVTTRYAVEGHAACDPDDPLVVGHLLLADIKRAIWGPKDPTLGVGAKDLRYIGKAIEPPGEGGAMVVVTVELEVSFAEDLASP